MIIKIFVFSFFILNSRISLAWSGRGHAAICEAAVHLVKSPQLKEFLLLKGHLMAYLCNIPDIYWKTLSSEFKKLGNTTHFLNSEKIGLKILEIPLNYQSIIDTYTGTVNKHDKIKKIHSIPEEMGSNWWRAEQFYRLALVSGKDLKNLPPPNGFQEEQSETLPFNSSFFQTIINLGLMGHFVGDNSQPFHVTSDYDGYDHQHGGIHSYYEEMVVGEFGPDLISLIVTTARRWKTQKFIEKSNLIENMRELASLSYSEVNSVFKLDPIIKTSEVKNEKGMVLKTPAIRKKASEGFKKMNKLIVTQMARSSFLLAHLWDKAYKDLGEPPIKHYKSYRFPFTPEYIMPDYIKSSQN